MIRVHILLLNLTLLYEPNSQVTYSYVHVHDLLTQVYNASYIIYLIQLSSKGTQGE